MSLSKEARAAECGTVLESMLAALGASAIDESLFDPEHPPFRDSHSTTWDELAGQGWIEELEGTYRLTGTGWLGALRLTKQLGDQRFLDSVGRALGAMKAHIKASGRKNAALVPLKQIAGEAGLPEGFVYNLIESRLVEEHHGRTGAKWRDKGRMILIPRDFNIEPADLNNVIREEADLLIDELKERLEMAEQELGRYQCPHCKSGLCSVGSVELSEHDSGTYESFECGYAAIDGWQQHPCPKDPKFPKLDEFELKTVQRGDEWMCYAIGKTPYAKQLNSLSAPGRTEDEARRRVIAQYNYKAGNVSNATYMEQMLG
jgi:hypothetical protein